MIAGIFQVHKMGLNLNSSSDAARASSLSWLRALRADAGGVAVVDCS
jgi:hypothetical protein